MKKKKLVSMSGVLIGIALVVVALYAMNRIAGVKSSINSGFKPFSKVPGSGIAKGVAEGEASQYDQTVRFVLIGGVVVIVIAGIYHFMGSKKRR